MSEMMKKAVKSKAKYEKKRNLKKKGKQGVEGNCNEISPQKKTFRNPFRVLK